MKTPNPNGSGIFRYPISEYGRQGKWDSQYLVHIARYGRASNLIEETAKSLPRPIKVIDIEEPFFSPTGAMRGSIGYDFILRDLTVNSILPAPDNSLDL